MTQSSHWTESEEVPEPKPALPAGKLHMQGECFSLLVRDIKDLLGKIQKYTHEKQNAALQESIICWKLDDLCSS